MIQPNIPLNSLSEDSLAVVQLESYVLRRIELDVPHQWVPAEHQTLDVKVKDSFGRSHDGKYARVGLACEVTATPQTEGYQLKLYVELEGTFSIHESPEGQYDVEAVDRALRENTLAVLFPYVRAALSTITATANIPVYVLPVFNIVELLREKEAEQQAETQESTK